MTSRGKSPMGESSHDHVSHGVRLTRQVLGEVPIKAFPHSRPYVGRSCGRNIHGGGLLGQKMTGGRVCWGMSQRKFP